jgi:hypothetical protein
MMSPYLQMESTEQLRKRLAQMGAMGPIVVAQALHGAAEDVMGEAKARYVPVRFGHLRDSGHVQPPALLPGHGVRVVLGFGGPSAPYAAYVHENPRAGKTQGVSPKGRRYKNYARVGQWKFLERPLKRARAAIMRRVAQDVRAAWRRWTK